MFTILDVSSAGYGMALDAGKDLIGRTFLDRSRSCAGTVGRKPASAAAADAGWPVYERMGYRPIATHRVFIEKKYLASH